MESLSRTNAGLLLWLTSGLVLVACLATWQIDNHRAFQLMRTAWPVVIFLLPVAFGVAGAFSLRPRLSQNSDVATAFNIPAAIVACLLLAGSYGMSVAVLSRLSSVWWAHVKFNEAFITLGANTAIAFGVLSAVVVATACYARRFNFKWAFVSQLFSAALGIAVSSSVLYFLLGVSPYVRWRA